MTLARIRSIVTNKQNISTGAFTAGRLVCTLLHMANGLLMVRLLDPVDLGFFNKNGVVLGYMLWFTLGVFSGLSRELPFYYGKKDISTAHSLASVVDAFAIILGGTAFLLFSVIALRYGLQKQYWHCAVWFSNAVVAFQIIYRNYLGVTFRTRHDFVKLASVDVSIAIISLASLVFVWRWQYYGLCFRAVFVAIITIAITYYYRPIHVTPHWDTKKFWHLFKTGLPIFMTGYVVSWWSATLSTTWIAWKMDALQMGLYSFPVFVFGTVTLFSNSFNQIYYPRLVESYAKDGDVRRLFRLLLKPICLLFLINGAMLIAGWLLMPYAVRWVAPKYIKSILPAQVMLLNLLIYWLDPALKIFYVIKRSGLFFVCIIFGIVINVFFLFYLEGRMGSLLGVITANMLGRACYMALSMFVLWFFVFRSATPMKKSPIV